MRVLLLRVSNAARSRMAEGLARMLPPARVQVARSAPGGLHPAPAR